MARVLVLDVIEGKGLYEAECTELDDYYEHLKCDTFDIATREIGGKYFDCFVDDIGLFNENCIPSVYDENLEVMLVGNVVFANHDSMGNTTSLSDEDIRRIRGCLMTMTFVRDESHGGQFSRNVIFPARY